MATPKGLFDPDLKDMSWFDDGQQIRAWFDRDLVDTLDTAANQTIVVSQSAAAKLAIQATASQSVTVAQSTAGALAIQGTASQAVVVAQSAAATLAIQATAAQSDRKSVV